MTALEVIEQLKKSAVSPYDELLTYEYLYSRKGETFKKITSATVQSNKLPSEVFHDRYGMILPGDFKDVQEYIDSKIGCCSFAINGTYSWPKQLEDSANPAPILYYRGNIGLLESKSVSIVGARKATHEGMSRAFSIAQQLIANDITIVTGLARGIDTAAANSVIENKGRIIGVIGTPIDEYYPKENKGIQDFVAQRNLLLSQVPFYRYKVQSFNSKKRYFPERNELMAAVSNATIIVEASDTSGSLTQARACLKQGRPLFIMESCAQNPSITWPKRFLKQEGVYTLRSVQDVLDVIGSK